MEASQWLHGRKVRAGDLEGRSKTIRDLEWRLSVVMDKFGPAPIDQVDFGLADELVVELCEERAAIERAAAEGAPLMRTVHDSRSASDYRARRRGVSNGSIRKALDAAERAADIEPVRHAAGEADEGALVEDRQCQRDVVKVAAGEIGIVGDVDIARLDVVATR